MKLDFHQKLLLGAIAFPDYLKFLIWIFLPLPHNIQVFKFIFHVRYRIELAVEGILDKIIIFNSTLLIHAFNFPEVSPSLALKTGTILLQLRYSRINFFIRRMYRFNVLTQEFL